MQEIEIGYGIYDDYRIDGGVGSGIKGHTTEKKIVSTERVKKAEEMIDKCMKAPEEIRKQMNNKNGDIIRNLLPSPNTIPQDKRIPFEKLFTAAEKIDSGEEKTKQEDVSIHDIVSNQPGLDRDALRKAIKEVSSGNYSSEDKDNEIWGVRYKGKVMLCNGNHRIAAALLLGIDKVNIGVYDVTGGE